MTAWQAQHEREVPVYGIASVLLHSVLGDKLRLRNLAYAHMRAHTEASCCRWQRYVVLTVTDTLYARAVMSEQAQLFALGRHTFS